MGCRGVGRCSCRASRKAIDDGCADDDFGWCIGVGDFADYCRETGKGHDITKEEALAILKRAEDNGFVHQITNIDGENKIVGHIDDINNLNNQKLQDLTDKRLVEVSGKEYEIILSLKQKEYIPYGQEQQKQSKNRQK